MMLLKKRVIRVFFTTLLIIGLFLTNSSQVMAAENLTIGSEGQGVKALQTALNTENYWCGDANGIFGPRTYNALIRYQRDNHMAVDGDINAAVKKALEMLPVKEQDAAPAVVKQTEPAVADATKVREVTQSVSRGSRPQRVITMVATGYTAAPEENWPYAGAPSYIGLPLARGIVAVDPDVIPMGTKLYVEGYGEAIAADQGGAINGNRIDLFFDSKHEAYDWGMRTVKVTIIE